MVERDGELKMENDIFKVPQKAVIKDGKKFLIMKRSPNAHVYPNQWDFTGGKLEHGEEPKAGLKREIKEETGLDVKIGNPEFVFSEKVKDHFIYLTVFNTTIEGEKEIKLSNEHTEFKWVTKEEILELGTENYLKAYMEGR